MKTAEPEKITVQYSVEFWMEEFQAAGFEFERSYKGDYHFVWHRSGDFHMGFERIRHVSELGTGKYMYRDFLFVHDGYSVPDDKFRLRFINSSVTDIDDFQLLLRAIIDPSLMPLLIGRKWALKIVTFFLQRSAARKN